MNLDTWSIQSEELFLIVIITLITESTLSTDVLIYCTPRLKGQLSIEDQGGVGQLDSKRRFSDIIIPLWNRFISVIQMFLESPYRT
jgi:hypothetical protein